MLHPGPVLSPHLDLFRRFELNRQNHYGIGRTYLLSPEGSDASTTFSCSGTGSKGPEYARMTAKDHMMLGTKKKCINCTAMDQTAVAVIWQL